MYDPAIWCCAMKCFVVPDDQVDGMACHKCKSYSYCVCRCDTYRNQKFSNPDACWMETFGYELEEYNCYNIIRSYKGFRHNQAGVFIRFRTYALVSQIFVTTAYLAKYWGYNDVDVFIQEAQQFIWLGREEGFEVEDL